MLKNLSFIFFSSVGLWLLACLVITYLIIARKDKTISVNDFNYKIDEVELNASDGNKISGWFIKGTSDRVVILLTGIGGDRTFCIERAKDYLNKGFNVMLPDLRATGKSDGNTISFGWHEKKDLLACYEFLKGKGYSNIAAHGTSLGAATIVYSLQNNPDYDFIVLESCYDNITNAYNNRMAKYPLSSVFFPVKHFVELSIGADEEQLQPKEFIKKANCPVLFLAGDSEFQLKLNETMSIYENCSSAQKKIFIFKTGKHEDFRYHFSADYLKIWNEFLVSLN